MFEIHGSHFIDSMYPTTNAASFRTYVVGTTNSAYSRNYKEIQKLKFFHITSDFRPRVILPVSNLPILPTNLYR